MGRKGFLTMVQKSDEGEFVVAKHGCMVENSIHETKGQVTNEDKVFAT